jgi:hypothetical protein
LSLNLLKLFPLPWASNDDVILLLFQVFKVSSEVIFMLSPRYSTNKLNAFWLLNFLSYTICNLRTWTFPHAQVVEL